MEDLKSAKYKYISPVKRGYTKVKIKYDMLKELNYPLPKPKISKYTYKVDVFVNDETILFHEYITFFGKMMIILISPLLFIKHGLNRTTLREIMEYLFPLKTGSFNMNIIHKNTKSVNTMTELRDYIYYLYGQNKD